MTATEPETQDTHFLIRPTPKGTLETLRDHFDTKTEAVVVDTSDVVVDPAERTVTFRVEDGTGSFIVPFNEVTMDHLSAWLGLPAAFMRKTDMDVQEFMFQYYIGQNPGKVVFDFNDDTGIHDIRNVTDRRVDPRRVIDVAAHVVGSNAPVIEGWRTAKEYRFDIVVADNADYGIAGDRQVNDITKGGLRFAQNLAEPLKPSVAPFMYRLACTNGMETPKVDLPISLRKATTVEEVMEALEEAAQEAFDSVEHQIESFYELRNERVTDADKLVMRIGRENGIPDGVRMDMLQRLPALLPERDQSLFDVINAVTNQANHPSLLAKAATRRRIEQAGGATLVDHADRCPRCQSHIV